MDSRRASLAEEEGGRHDPRRGMSKRVDREADVDRMEAQLESSSAKLKVKHTLKDLEEDLKRLMRVREGFGLDELRKDGVKEAVRGSIVRSITDAIERADDSEAYREAVIRELQEAEKEETRKIDRVVKGAQVALVQLQERLMDETVEAVRDRLATTELDSDENRAEALEGIQHLFNLSYETCKELHENIIRKQEELVEHAEKGTNALRLKAYARLAILLPQFPGFPPSDSRSRVARFETMIQNDVVEEAGAGPGDAAGLCVHENGVGGPTHPSVPTRKWRWMKRIGSVLLVPVGIFLASRHGFRRKGKAAIRTEKGIQSHRHMVAKHPKVTLIEKKSVPCKSEEFDFARG